MTNAMLSLLCGGGLCQSFHPCLWEWKDLTSITVNSTAGGESMVPTKFLLS